MGSINLMTSSKVSLPTVSHWNMLNQYENAKQGAPVSLENFFFLLTVFLFSNENENISFPVDVFIKSQFLSVLMAYLAKKKAQFIVLTRGIKSTTTRVVVPDRQATQSGTENLAIVCSPSKVNVNVPGQLQIKTKFRTVFETGRRVSMEMDGGA